MCIPEISSRNGIEIVVVLLCGLVRFEFESDEGIEIVIVLHVTIGQLTNYFKMIWK